MLKFKLEILVDMLAESGVPNNTFNSTQSMRCTLVDFVVPRRWQSLCAKEWQSTIHAWRCRSNGSTESSSDRFVHMLLIIWVHLFMLC
eukprot:SAG31_NODE_20913_length_562_cov_1.274298_1_plen_87_part_10